MRPIRLQSLFVLCVLALLAPALAAADLKVEVKVPLFAVDGETGELSAAVTDSDKPMDGAVILFEVYMAQGTDTRSHDIQMQEMAEIKAGRKPAPVFRLGDVKLTGEPQRLVGTPRGNGLYTTPYRFPHGRIFVKVTTLAGGRTVVSPFLYSTRIHCDQVILDGLERQREFLDHAREIVWRGNFAMLEKVATAMRKDLDTGHSLRYMLVHHEKDPRPYDDGLAGLAFAAGNKNAGAATAALERLDKAYADALEIFLTVNLASDGPIAVGRPASLHLTLLDPINNHPLRMSLVIVQPGVDRATETHARAEVFRRQLHAGQAAGHHGAHMRHAPGLPPAVPSGIVPRTNPDGSFTFSHVFEAPGEKVIRLNIYYDGRQFTHDVAITVPRGN